MDSHHMPKVFLKFRHKSCVFTPQAITQLLNSGALDVADFVALVFLMCDVLQMEAMHTFLGTWRYPDLPPNFSEVIQTFPNWEQKCLAALVCIGNKQALMELGLSFQDVERKIMSSSNVLSPSRVVLYKIFECLNRRRVKTLVENLYQVGAPQPEHEWERLELYFMFWHQQGFVDVDNPYSFEVVAQSLKRMDCCDLADSLLEPTRHLLYNSISDDDFTLGVYHIRNPLKPGLCIIINQVKYGSEERNRDSSVLDRDRLTELMSTLNFAVILFENVDSSGFCSNIKAAVEQNFENEYSIFVLIIMAHGESGVIFCPDATPTKEDKTQEFNNSWLLSSGSRTLERFDLGHVYVDSIQKTLLDCEILRTIPKVLILNACRGKDLFTTKPYVPESVAPPPLQYIDLITCYSALPDFVSLRPEKGSIFIIVLCDVLRTRPDIEICELFTLVNARLMQPTAEMSRSFEPGQRPYEEKLASPFDFTSSLRKKLYLKMPNPGDLKMPNPGDEGVS